MTISAGQLRLLPSSRGTGPRYGSLLLILVITYLLSALTVGGLVSAVQVLLFLAVVLIALRSGQFHRKTVQILAVGLLLGTTAAAILALVDQNGQGGALANLWTALILVLAVFFIVRQVLAQPEITEQSIYGALSAYMMIGLIFSAVYLAMWKFTGISHSFFANGDKPNTKLFQYFSFTTLTTLGYGDFTAAGDGGRAVAVLEAMIGQMFLATLVARLVAGFRWSDRAAARRGAQEARRAAGQGPHVSGTEPGSGPGGSRPGVALPPTVAGASGAGPPSPGVSQPSASADAGPGTGAPGPGPAVGTGSPGPGRGRAKKASAPGLIRLSPPGAVRGRGTGQRLGERKGARGSGPAPPVPASGPEPGDPEDRRSGGPRSAPGGLDDFPDLPAVHGQRVDDHDVQGDEDDAPDRVGGDERQVDDRADHRERDADHASPGLPGQHSEADQDEQHTEG
jgi:hypothetical protein